MSKSKVYEISEDELEADPTVIDAEELSYIRTLFRYYEKAEKGVDCNEQPLKKNQKWLHNLKAKKEALAGEVKEEEAEAAKEVKEDDTEADQDRKGKGKKKKTM